MTMKGDKAFVDTNVLLRAMIPQMAHNQPCELLIQRMWEDNVDLWISRQVVREYLVQVTHPNSFSPALTFQQIQSQINQIKTLFRVADETEQTTSQLLQLLQDYPTVGKQIHDANIVATMLVYGIDTLLTINLDNLKRFASKITLISPLAIP